MLSDTYIHQTAADAAFIDVRQLPAQALVASLIWDRAGQQRLVPPSVRGNVMTVWSAGKTLLAAGTIAAIPDEWCRIVWAQCSDFVVVKAITPADLLLLKDDAVAAVRTVLNVLPLGK